MSNLIPAFIFDLDGTLVHFSPAYSRRYAQIIRETFATFSITPKESLIKKIEEFGDFEEIIKLIGDERAEYFWFKVDQADFRLRKEILVGGDITLAPGATDTLQKLQKILSPDRPLSLVSNTHPTSAFWELWHFSLLPLFRHIYLLSWNFEVPKPDPAGFLACVKEYGPIGSVPVVFVGDSPSDVQTVYRAKQLHPELVAHAVLVDGRKEFAQTPSSTHTTISSLTQLLPLARSKIDACEFP